MAENIFYVIGVIIVAAVVGNVLGGYIEDHLWITGGQALPDCEKIQEDGWKEHCFTIYENYYDTKFQYQTIGTIVPSIIGVIAIWKTI